LKALEKVFEINKDILQRLRCKQGKNNKRGGSYNGGEPRTFSYAEIAGNKNRDIFFETANQEKNAR
jgi:hypothetical protein